MCLVVLPQCERIQANFTALSTFYFFWNEERKFEVEGFTLFEASSDNKKWHMRIDVFVKQEIILLSKIIQFIFIKAITNVGKIFTSSKPAFVLENFDNL